MKLKQSIGTFLIYSLLIIGCTKDEELSYENEFKESIPEIGDATLDFVLSEDQTRHDALKLSFEIKDAEWDIGLYYTDIDSPYHNFWLYKIENHLLKRFVPERYQIDRYYHITSVSDVHSPLATFNQVRKSDPNIEFFPCFEFMTLTFLGSERLMDDHTSIEDSLDDRLILYDTIMIELNENALNILVDFLVEQEDGSYLEFDWVRELCSTYNGRIPNFSTLTPGTSEESGPFKMERISKTKGRLTYKLMSLYFQHLFGGKKVKLRFYIKDRALHNSNILETEPILIPTTE